jgi:Tol biopolymer transport system component
VFEKLTGIKGAFRTRIAYVVQTNGGQFPYELRVTTTVTTSSLFTVLHSR